MTWQGHISEADAIRSFVSGNLSSDVHQSPTQNIIITLKERFSDCDATVWFRTSHIFTTWLFFQHNSSFRIVTSKERKMFLKSLKLQRMCDKTPCFQYLVAWSFFILCLCGHLLGNMKQYWGKYIWVWRFSLVPLSATGRE